MKWKFSKVTALLLAGAMVVTSGCTDYKDDIQDLNKRLDDLNAETVANFETQKTAMETLQKELEKADDDIQKNIDNIESDIKKLQDADATLKKAMEDADAALKKELEAADAALKKAMEDADKQLKQAMESGDAATLAAAKADAKANLDAAKAELQKQIEGVQSNLDSEIKKVNEIIATLATKEELAGVKTEMQEKLEYAVAVLNQRIDKEVKTLNSTIETAVEELKAMIAALDAKKLDKQVFEDYKTEVARHFAEIENSIAVLETKLTAQIARVEADLKGRIAALEGRMADAEAALRKIEGEIIPGINAHIETLYEQISKNANDLAAYKALTDQTLAYLMEAVTSLQNGLATGLDSVNGRVDSLDNKLEQYYSNIQAALNDRVLTAVFEQYKQDVEWKLKEMKADYESQIAATKDALEKKIAACEQLAIELNAAMMQNLNGQVANLKQAIAESEARSKQEIAAVKSELEQKLAALENRVSAIEDEIKKMQTAISDLEDGLRKAVEDIKEITREGGLLATAIDGVLKAHAIDVANINERIKTLSGRVDQLEIDVDDLLNRIQSIVYVPDYNDGKITIEYALLNGKVVEGQSKITYKVLPASETNTTLLAQAWKADNSILDFASHEVAIRAAGNEMFQIKDVEANGDLLTLTVATRGLGDDFYAENPTKSYSIALLVNYENNIRSTEYANCVAGEPKEIDLYILKEDKTDITDTEKVANYKIQYIDLGAEYGHNVLAGHYPAFSINGGADRFTLAEMTEKGYAIDLVSEIAYDVEGENVFVNAPNEEGEVEFGTIANVSLGEEKAAAVGAVETVMYNYTACGKTVYTTATVTVTKITSKVEFAPAEIKWNYLLDAASDASEDVDTARENYVIAIANSTLPSETDWAGVLAGELAELTVNGAVVEAPVVVFDKDAEGAPVVNLTKFEWNKEYKIVAEYALSNVDVTVSLTVNTFDRAREAITIDLGTKDWNFVRDLEIAAGEIEDNLSVVYDAINGPREGQEFAALDGVETAAFLTDIFANEEHALTDVKNIVGDKEMKEEWISKLTIAEDGQTVSAVYTYKSSIAFDENGDLKYTKTFTTWYGQEVTLVKTIHFVLPKYDYQDSEYFVEMLDGLYFSSVNPKYADSENNALNDKMSSQVYFYDVWNVDMNQAFNVIDENGVILEADAEAAAGLVRVFEIETPEAERPGITMTDNEIYYGGAAKYVDVFGRLYIENSNGSRVELPTSFANTYANYQVQKYVPLEPMGNEPLACTVDNANTYTINVLEGVVLKDKRGFDLIKDGAFVVGNGVDNGFAADRNVKDVYGLEIVYTDDMATLTPNIKPFISWDAENTSVVFNYNGQMDLKKPVEVTVRIAIKYTWGGDYTDVKCVFKKAE